MTASVCVALVSGCAPATMPPPLASPPYVATIDTLLERYAERGMAGVVLLQRDGVNLLYRGVGTIEPGGTAPMPRDARFDVGSITKTFTASAVFHLVRDGKLRLTDSLGRFVRDLPEDRRGITIHHLLTHSAGLPLDSPEAGVPATADAEVLLESVRRARLAFPAGRGYQYSNYGYGILAAIVARVSGEHFPAYVMRTVVAPAGLLKTRFYQSRLPDSGMTPSFRRHSDGVLRPDTVWTQGVPNGVQWGKYVLGASGVVSTVGDLASWFAALHDGRVLTSGEQALMFTPREGTQGYGWNIIRTQDSIPRLYRGGSRGGYRSLLSWYPERRVLLAYAINSDAGWDGALWNAVEGVLAGRAVVIPPAVRRVPMADISALVGTYALDAQSHLRVIARKGQFGPELIVFATGQPAVNALLEPGRADAQTYGLENEGTSAIVAALVNERPMPMAFVSDTASVRRDWKRLVQGRGRLVETQVIGSIPLPAPTPRVQTFVTLRFANASEDVTVRFGWQGGKPFGYGGEVPPVSLVVAPAGDGWFASFDPFTSAVRWLRFTPSHKVEVFGSQRESAPVARAMRP